MAFEQFALYVKYFSIFLIGVIIGRLTMAIEYAFLKPK